jgi:hypothetical protein
MTPQEKILYHQIHAAKLLTDWSTGLLALYFFWRHDFVAAVMTALIPAMVVSSLLIKFANLERQRASRFGHYVQRYMTRTMEALRLVGYIIMAAGAWYHALFFIGLGLLIVLGAWLNGVASGQSSK